MSLIPILEISHTGGLQCRFTVVDSTSPVLVEDSAHAIARHDDHPLGDLSLSSACSFSFATCDSSDFSDQSASLISPALSSQSASSILDLAAVYHTSAASGLLSSATVTRTCISGVHKCSESRSIRRALILPQTSRFDWRFFVPLGVSLGVKVTPSLDLDASCPKGLTLWDDNMLDSHGHPLSVYKSRISLLVDSVEEAAAFTCTPLSPDGPQCGCRVQDVHCNNRLEGGLGLGHQRLTYGYNEADILPPGAWPLAELAPSASLARTFATYIAPLLLVHLFTRVSLWTA